jgi:hypothetical protein
MSTTFPTCREVLRRPVLVSLKYFDYFLMR